LSVGSGHINTAVIQNRFDHADDEQAGTHVGEKAMPEMTMTLSVSFAARTAALIAEQQQKIAALEAPHRLVPLARSVDPQPNFRSGNGEIWKSTSATPPIEFAVSPWLVLDRVESSSTDDSRLRGARPIGDISGCQPRPGKASE
jgi:hypothetical protein